MQNIAIALGLKAVFMALAFTGHATLWMAVFADMGASLIVVANGLRLLRHGGAQRITRLTKNGANSSKTTVETTTADINRVA